MALEKVVTVIVQRDGKHRLTTEQCTPEDALRWADEGLMVFQIAVRRSQWAVYQVNNRRLFTDATPSSMPDAIDAAGAVLQRLLTNKGEG